MTKTITAIVFILGFLILIYINKPSGHEQELLRQRKELDKKYSNTIDSIRLQYRIAVERNDRLTQKALKDSLKYVEAKQTAEVWRKKYNHEKNNNRHFSDNQLDSLISAIH